MRLIWIPVCLTPAFIFPAIPFSAEIGTCMEGGVCFYVHTGLQASVLSPSRTGFNVESLYIQVHLSTKPKPTQLVLASVYRPPSTTVDSWESLCNEIDCVTARNNKLVILGDFNTNVFQFSSHHYGHLRSLCSEFCLKNIVTVPTRYPSGTCLDLILVHADVPCVFFVWICPPH